MPAIIRLLLTEGNATVRQELRLGLAAAAGLDVAAEAGTSAELLALVADGLINAEIAERLFTSKRTVETHRQNIIAKTQARNTAALIKLAEFIIPPPARQ